MPGLPCAADGSCPTGQTCYAETQTCLLDNDIPVCGNGVIESIGEVCDDGNTLSGDGCSADCDSNETCGNAVLDPGEVCDDGNNVPGDGCSADCGSDETCGNAVLDPGEICDDGNNLPGDSCPANCQFTYPPPACQLQITDGEPSPGYPFQAGVFRSDIWPILQASCGAAIAGCHGYGNDNRYTVVPDTGADCDYVTSFNEFYHNTDFRQNVSNSVVLIAARGGVTSSRNNHPPILQQDSPDYVNIKDYIKAGFDNYAANGGGGGNTSFYYDADVYADQIQPQFDQLGCIVPGCHDRNTTAGGFGLAATPLRSSPELQENLQAVATRIDLSVANPEQTVIYDYATRSHAANQVFDSQARGALDAWIQFALDKVNIAPDSPAVAGCQPLDAVNLDVFAEEIEPILLGRVDLNDPPDPRVTSGCARSECHGRDRGPGKFYVDDERTTQENFDNFSCFINFDNPALSQLLTCPLDSRGCQFNGSHPGEDFFDGVTDLNYQRILSYIYVLKDGRRPLDFAFFVNRINVIFNDPNAVRDGALNTTCADGTCHGSQDGVTPPLNGSNFPIIAEAADKRRLLLNFISASNFTVFGYRSADQSSLFLYPTNEIANINHPLTTEIPHPGGEYFAVDDPEALDILKWAAGLRTDSQGFLLDYLVGGDFPASQVTDEAIFNEDSIMPRIFDISGGPTQFNGGLWDGLFSADPVVDLNDRDQGFFRDRATDRLVYAIAYVVNTSTRSISTIFSIASANDIEFFAGNQSTQALANQQATLRIDVPSYLDNQQITRIMIKVFQTVDDVDFNFQLNIVDEDGNLLDEDLVFTLSPQNTGI